MEIVLCLGLISVATGKSVSSRVGGKGKSPRDALAMLHREGFAADITPQLLPEGSTLLTIGTPTTFFLIGQKMNAIDALPEQLKKPRGRPPKAVKVAIPKPMTMARYADSPPPMLPKTELQRVKELKELLIHSAGSNVVHKAVEIAMNDEHPAQMAAIKLCMDRMLPVSLFEKEGKQRSAVTINITGIGEISHAPVVDAEDIEEKNG